MIRLGTNLRRARLTALAVVVAAGLAVPAAGLGAGGDDLTAAPELPTTVRQFSAKFGADFWRVYLNVGDLMTVDYSSSDGDKIAFCLLPPGVAGTSDNGITIPTSPARTASPPTATVPTQTTPFPTQTTPFPTTTTPFPTTTTPFPTTTTPTPTTPTLTTPTLTAPSPTATLTDDQCAARDTTFTKARVTLSVVNPPGYWTLVFADGLCAPHNYSTMCRTYDVAYSVILSVRRFTQTIAALPAAGRRNGTVSLSGRVIGMTGGYVEIRVQRKGKWRSLGLVSVNATGQFSRKVRLPSERGLYPYRVTFYGDNEHRPSGRTLSIRVA